MQQDSLVVPDNRQCAQSIAFNGTFFVMGGWMRRISLYTDFWVYNIATKSWALLPITAVSPRVSGTVVEINGLHYLYGGIFRYNNGTMFLLGVIFGIYVCIIVADLDLLVFFLLLSLLFSFPL